MQEGLVVKSCCAPFRLVNVRNCLMIVRDHHEWVLQIDVLSIAACVKIKVNYVLGANPRGMSYMTGFGSYYPKQVHHRGASMDSIHVHPAKIGCGVGFNDWYARVSSNPNLITGAVVGGPNSGDGFDDLRSSSAYTEPTTYVNAPLVGLMARMLYA